MTDEPKITKEPPGYPVGYWPANGYLTVKPIRNLPNRPDYSRALPGDLDWEHMG